MSAPVIIDLGGAPWSGFTLSGITGTSAADINGDYYFDSGTGDFVHAVSGAKFVQAGATSWDLDSSGGTGWAGGTGGAWPWLCEWTPDSGAATGTYAFAQITAPPTVVEIDGTETPVAATLTTALTGSNNDLTFEAQFAGELGDTVSIRYLNPASNNATLSVSVATRAITVSLATDGSGVITSTAAQIAAAISGSVGASALVSAANAAGNNGTGVVTALAATFLSGGSGGLPLPPLIITL